MCPGHQRITIPAGNHLTAMHRIQLRGQLGDKGVAVLILQQNIEEYFER